MHGSAAPSSLILVDLPVEQHPELRRIQLVAPTSTEERIRAAAEATDGWLYLVSVTGTTGARTELSPALPPFVQRVRDASDVPVYVGFGISTPELARAAAELADGVVVGSRAVQVAEDGPDALRDFVASLRDGARLLTTSHAASQVRLTCGREAFSPARLPSSVSAGSSPAPATPPSGAGAGLGALSGAMRTGRWSRNAVPRGSRFTEQWPP